MVVYLDVLFAVNALMDGATLLAAARLGGVQVRKNAADFLSSTRRRLCRAGCGLAGADTRAAAPSCRTGACA